MFASQQQVGQPKPNVISQSNELNARGANRTSLVNGEVKKAAPPVPPPRLDLTRDDSQLIHKRNSLNSPTIYTQNSKLLSNSLTLSSSYQTLLNSNKNKSKNLVIQNSASFQQLNNQIERKYSNCKIYENCFSFFRSLFNF